MLMFGKQIAQVSDPLTEVSVDRVFKALTNTNGSVATLVHRLQFIRTIDLHQYRKLKSQLPYIVCGQFFPPIRKKENFVNTQRFIVDIDHFYEHDIDLQKTKQELIKDENIELLFTSPGGDGLKVLFKLKEKISDIGYYTIFYKAFCIKFGEKYRLGASIDLKTHDVTRCCFVSFDTQAYYNPKAESLDASLFVDQTSFTDLNKVIKEIQNNQRSTDSLAQKIPSNITQELPIGALDLIKQKLGQKIKEPKIRILEQREELDPIVEEIKSQLIEVGARVEKITPISYGRQIKIIADQYWAEINIFYGKKGLSIVGTSKTGSNKNLCDGVVSLLKNHFS